jgi:hypothetical protein
LYYYSNTVGRVLSSGFSVGRRRIPIRCPRAIPADQDEEPNPGGGYRLDADFWQQLPEGDRQKIEKRSFGVVRIWAGGAFFVQDGIIHLAFTQFSGRWVMTKIGNFESLERVPELSADSVVPARAPSVASVPLDAFPTDGILPPQGPVPSLEGASAHLPAVTATSADEKLVETSPQQHSASEITTADDLTAESQLKLQQLMEKKTQMESTQSNVLKPFDDDQRGLVANIK